MALKTAARGAGAAEQYRRTAVAKLIPIAQERVATAVGQIDLSAFDRRINALIDAKLNPIIKDLTKRIEALEPESSDD